MELLHQGDILKIEKIKHPVLVVSKDLSVWGCNKADRLPISEMINGSDGYSKDS